MMNLAGAINRAPTGEDPPVVLLADGIAGLDGETGRKAWVSFSVLCSVFPFPCSAVPLPPSAVSSSSPLPLPPVLPLLFALPFPP